MKIYKVNNETKQFSTLALAKKYARENLKNKLKLFKLEDPTYPKDDKVYSFTKKQINEEPEDDLPEYNKSEKKLVGVLTFESFNSFAISDLDVGDICYYIWEFKR